MAHSPAKRPVSVTLTAVLILTLALINVWRFVALSGQLELLLEIGGSLDPRWRMGFALVWAALFFDASAAVWRRRRRSRYAAPLILFLYAAYEMSLLAWFVQSPVARQGWPADLLFYLLAVGGSHWALNRPAARSYFKI